MSVYKRQATDWCEAGSQEAEMVRVVVGEVAALDSKYQERNNSSDIGRFNVPKWRVLRRVIGLCAGEPL